MIETYVANARLVLPGEIFDGGVTLGTGLITDITTVTAMPPGATDLDGDLLIAGLVELHTDNLERHIEPRSKVDWPRRTAILAHDGELAACGITTVCDALRLGSASDPDSSYGEYARKLSGDIQA